MNSSAPKLLERGGTLKDLVAQPAYADRFKQVLGDRAPQFVSSLLSLGAEMYDVEPKSVIASAMIAASLDLPINKNLGYAWIVPYKREGKKYGQFQMGYKGYVQLATRTNQYARLNTCDVFAGEVISYNKLTGELVLDPEKRASDVVIGYAAYFKLVSGYEHAQFWTQQEVEAHAKRYSQAYSKGYETPWKTHFDGMARKTVLKDLLAKWGPLSVQMQKAVAMDQGVVKDIDAEVEYVDNLTDTPPPPKLGRGEPAIPDDDQVPGAEPAEASVGIPETPADLPDLDKPYDEIRRFMARDGITEEQLMAHLVSIKVARASQKLNDLSAEKAKSVLVQWKVHYNSIANRPKE